jgi:hypothetical protein
MTLKDALRTEESWFDRNGDDYSTERLIEEIMDRNDGSFDELDQSVKLAWGEIFQLRSDGTADSTPAYRAV